MAPAAEPQERFWSSLPSSSTSAAKHATVAARGAAVAAAAVAAAVSSPGALVMEHHHSPSRTTRGGMRSARCLAASALVLCLFLGFFVADLLITPFEIDAFALPLASWPTSPSLVQCSSLRRSLNGCSPLQGRSLRPVSTAVHATSPPAGEVAIREKMQDAYRAVEGAVSQKVASQRRQEGTARSWRKAAVNWPEPPKPKVYGEEWEQNLRYGHNKLFNVDENGFFKYGEITPVHAERGIRWITHKTGDELWGLYCQPFNQPHYPDIQWSEIMWPLEYFMDMHENVYSAVKFIRDVLDLSPEMSDVWNYTEVVRLYSLRRIWRCEKFMPKFKALLKSERSSEAQRRVVASLLITFQRNGVNTQELSVHRNTPEEFIAYVTLSRQVAFISRKWDQNIEKDMEKKAILVRDKYELNGLPMYVIEDAAAAARVMGYPKATTENGPWMITMDDEMVEPILKFGQARGFREVVHGAYHRVGFLGGAGKGDNGPYLLALLDLRLSMANVLGYATYAEMMFTMRMATLRQAYGFLARIRKESVPAARRELREIREFARSEGADYELEHFDIPYWRERFLASRLSLQEDYFRQYFPLDAVLEGLFGLVERLFGVKVVLATDEVHVWDEHVRFYRMREVDGGGEVASFFLDPFRRRGRKRSGFWVQKIHGYSSLMGSRVTGEPRRPAVHIVADVMPPPVLPDGTNGTALLTPPQVSKLFFHMGQALRTLLCNQTEGLVAGTTGMEPEAANIPAYLLERLAWEPSTLRSMTWHFETGDPMPEAAIQTLSVSRAVHNGMRVLRQVAAAQVDLELHTRFDPNGTMSVFDVARIIEAENAVMPPRIEDHDLCKSDINTERGTSLYAELWAEALAYDAFVEFEEVIDDQDAVSALGRRFRRTILAPGAGRAPAAALRDFHGRGLSLAPFVHYLGLTSPEDEEDEGDDVEEIVVTGEDAMYEAYEDADVEDDEEEEDDDEDGITSGTVAAADDDDRYDEDEVDVDYYEDASDVSSDAETATVVPPTTGKATSAAEPSA